MACDYLIDQALQKVWCSPRQDTQAILEPKRISPFNGFWNTFNILNTKYILPEAKTKFHVYQVGQLYPLLAGFFPIQDKWVTLAEQSEIQRMIVNVYSDKGIEMPRFECWYLTTPDRNLLIAVKDQGELIDFDLNVEKLYLRVYSNAYFNRLQGNSQYDFIKVVSKRVKTNEDLAWIRGQYESFRNRDMNVPLLYINGRKENIANTATIKLGDVVEFVVDTSIKRYVEFNVKDLRTFDSIKDKMRKYLLHYLRAAGDEGIDYHDDIDVYIVRKDPKGVDPRMTGFYYHRNKSNAMRNITHRDYSLNVAYTERYMKQDTPVYNEDKSILGWTVQLYIRKSGWNRKLVNTFNRLKQLYALPDEKVVNALLGIESVIPEWRADNLENGAYTAVMSNEDYNLDKRVVEDMWGYDAASVMVGDTPMKVEMYSGQKGVALPLMLRRYSTAFEYDQEGRLLGWNTHVSGDRYTVANQKCELVEVLSGYADKLLDETYNQEYSHWDKDFDYRLYRKRKEPVGDYTDNWHDVTKVDGVYVRDVTNSRFQWLHDMNEWDCIVRSDKTILITEVRARVQDGLLYFPLVYLSNRNATIAYERLEIGYTETDVFLNGYSLVEGVDYFLDGTNVCIINKEFLDDPANKEQWIVVRNYGLPNERLERHEKEDIGWVRWNVLSRNNRYDIRDDRVMRITVNGRLIHKSDLVFSETDDGVGTAKAVNSTPYEIKDLLVPMRGLISQDLTAWRNRSYDLDKRLSAYMSQYIREPRKTTESATKKLWKVYSPFCSKVLMDLKRGVLRPEKIREYYDDNYVMSVIKPYLYLLRVDPTQEDTLADFDFVKVHSHAYETVQDIDVFMYRFMERVISLVLKDRVDLSQFARIV